jgi:NAD(P)-dependent dehydrogenase (short-subunit alcohol dehydrogenase family)
MEGSNLLLKNKVAVITGGAAGMGKAMAQKFAGEGCDIVVADINPEGAKKVADEIGRQGRKAAAIKVDMCNSTEIKSMIDQSIKEFGRIDILVNNAGAAGGASLEASDEEEWDRVLALNLKGAFIACKATVPHMKKQGYGKIINISSMGAVRPSVSVMAYHSAKAGILGLTLNLAFELAPFNIYVNCIVPGPIETPFWDPLSKGMSTETKKAFFAALAKKEVPLGRMGTPEDIAGPALFFASDLSSYVTGQILCVAGGQPGITSEMTFISSEESKKFRQ